MANSCRVLQVANDRIPRTARVIRRALKEHGAKAFPSQATAKCRDEPRLTYSGFARNCYQLSFPALGVVKVPEQLFKLALPPAEWGQLGTSTRIKSASDGTRTQNA